MSKLTHLLSTVPDLGAVNLSVRNGKSAIQFRHRANATLITELTLRFKINGGGGRFVFFVIFGDPPQLILTLLFMNFLNFSRGYTEVHKYITDS